jgi:MerR family transcriptional regulator, heat shock protein HspR
MTARRAAGTGTTGSSAMQDLTAEGRVQTNSADARPDVGKLPEGAAVAFAAFETTGFEIDAPLFVISVAAQLAGMHAQTLRSYDREGLVSPGRTSGGGRRYSRRDIELLREVQKLSQDQGVNRAGIRRIIELEAQVDALKARAAELLDEVRSLHAQLNQSQADAANAAANAIAGLRRDVVPWRNTTTAMVTWRPQRRRP